MLRLLACAGHGSIIWVILFTATASPAARLTLSRRSRYMSVQAPVSVLAASARTRQALFRDMARSLRDVEDVPDRRGRAVRAALQATLHRHGDLALAEQEELRIVRRLAAVE